MVYSKKGHVNSGEGDEKELSQFLLHTANYIPNNHSPSPPLTTKPILIGKAMCPVASHELRDSN